MWGGWTHLCCQEHEGEVVAAEDEKRAIVEKEWLTRSSWLSRIEHAAEQTWSIDYFDVTSLCNLFPSATRHSSLPSFVLPWLRCRCTSNTLERPTTYS